MTRILYVIATLDQAGAERQMTQLARRLDRVEFEPVVCCLTRGGPLEAELRAANISTHILGKKGRWDLRVFPRLLRLIQEVQPQIIHTWLPTANTIGRIAGIMAGAPALIASERAKDAWKGPFRRWIDRALARHTAMILTNAHAVKRFLADDVRLPDAKIAVIANGLDLAEFDTAAARESSPLPEANTPVIGTVARLEPQKGIEYLLDAFAQLRRDGLQAQLWIVGDGPERAQLVQKAGRLEVSDAVKFIGRRSDVPAIMRRLDLFVLPSLWEGLPNVALEAMAAERAVVATTVDGTPEAVCDGETGVLVPPADAAALAAAMRQLLTNHKRRREMGRAGRKRVENNFSMKQMVERTEAVYREATRG